MAAYGTLYTTIGYANLTYFRRRRDPRFPGLGDAHQAGMAWSQQEEAIRITDQSIQSSEVPSDARLVRLSASHEICYEVGANPTATKDGPRLGPNDHEFINCVPADKIAIISGAVPFVEVTSPITEATVVVGNDFNVVFKLRNARWASTLGANNTLTTNFAYALEYPTYESEGNGASSWYSQVGIGMAWSDVTRDDDYQVTVAVAGNVSFAITNDDVLQFELPAGCIESLAGAVYTGMLVVTAT